MKTLDSMPETKDKDRDKLTLPHIRVLHALANSGGPLTRGRLSSKIGNKTNVVVGRAVGYSDPEKRARFEQTKDGGFTASLLTRGYVEETELDIDGLIEMAVAITEEGRQALEELGDLDLPPLRD